MNGPEHYREAERLIAAADQLDTFPSEEYAQLVAAARAHATLANVVATMATGMNFTGGHADEWRQAIGMKEPKVP
jgi:hypothetical protein